MSKTVALLSGKGGSGKTTLSLSMASMLSSCGIKVLVVDCDLSTNGATYFYEERLTENKGNICAFYDVITMQTNIVLEAIHITDFFDFIPSIKRISKETTNTFSFSEGDEKRWEIFKEKLAIMYDVILLDCQAGYADILKTILPSVDVSLVVMETDAISSSAIRSLYLKIGEIIDEKKTYQVFNKVSSDEYENYSKISGGTVFVNIETVLFDWKIRKAFSVAQIPDMEHSSANYGAQVFNICKILFTDSSCQKKLQKYGTVIELKKRTEDKERLEKKIQQAQAVQKKERNKILRKLYTLVIPAMLVLSLLLFWVIISQKNIFSEATSTAFSTTLAVTALMGTLLITWLSIFELLKDRKSRFIEVESYKVDLSNINKSINELQKYIADTKNQNISNSKTKRTYRRKKEG